MVFYVKVDGISCAIFITDKLNQYFIYDTAKRIM